MFRYFAVAALLAVLLPAAARGEPLLVCGAETVFEIDAEAAAEGTIEKTWVWDARQCQELPEPVRAAFKTTDDCKPIAGGAKVLVSSSSGGCALVERPSGRVIWYARVANAHSLALLPRERIVVASSVSPQGNRLVLFDIGRSDAPLAESPLPSAHGVVWDAGRELLWALGLDELRCYRLEDWETPEPSLTLHDAHRLPDGDGHDLQPLPATDDLVVTTGRHVYLFDRENGRFRLHPDLGATATVKSVSVHPVTGRAVFVQATESWWSDRLGLLAPPGSIQLPGERLYKARWLSREPAGGGR